MSPRKSSTSSGNPPSPRPRYLGIEVAGDLSLAPRWVERELARLLEEDGRRPGVRVRLVRWEGRRGIAEVAHTVARAARSRWNARLTGPAGEAVELATVRTWGTLRKGKEWLRTPPPSAPLPVRDRGIVGGTAPKPGSSLPSNDRAPE